MLAVVSPKLIALCGRSFWVERPWRYYVGQAHVAVLAHLPLPVVKSGEGMRVMRR